MHSLQNKSLNVNNCCLLPLVGNSFSNQHIRISTCLYLLAASEYTYTPEYMHNTLEIHTCMHAVRYAHTVCMQVAKGSTRRVPAACLDDACVVPDYCCCSPRGCNMSEQEGTTTCNEEPLRPVAPDLDCSAASRETGSTAANLPGIY